MARRFGDRGWPDFGIGIGLHSGEAVVGNIGSPRRFEFTAIGDTVNSGARLESLSKELGWTIVASEATVQAAGRGVAAEGRRELKVKGRRQTIAVLEITGWLEDADKDENISGEVQGDDGQK